MPDKSTEPCPKHESIKDMIVENAHNIEVLTRYSKAHAEDIKENRAVHQSLLITNTKLDNLQETIERTQAHQNKMYEIMEEKVEITRQESQENVKHIIESLGKVMSHLSSTQEWTIVARNAFIYAVVGIGLWFIGFFFANGGTL